MFFVANVPTADEKLLKGYTFKINGKDAEIIRVSRDERGLLGLVKLRVGPRRIVRNIYRLNVVAEG